MINEKVFRLKKDGTPNYTCFCRHPELIENYDKAIADKTQTWECHHMLETHTSDGVRRLVDLSKQELIALDMYYDRSPEELIFLTSADHVSLHNKFRPSNRRGVKLSEETKAKISASNKGKKPSEEAKAKMSEAKKAYWSRKRGE